MLRASCLEADKDWDKGAHLLLFSACEAEG